IIADEKLTCDYAQVGGLTLFKSKKGFEHAHEEVEEMAKFGIDLKLLNGDAVRKLEPMIRDDVFGGIYNDEDAHLDPALFVEALSKKAEKCGARVLRHTKVLGFEKVGRRITSVHTTHGSFYPKEVILAAGAWSKKLAKKLNLNFPMQAAKGYSITMEKPVEKPRIPLFLGESKVAVTPIGKSLRFAGTLELTGIDLSINQGRINAIMDAAKSYLNGISSEVQPKFWSGLRPVPPDGLPYIGRTNTVKNLIIATGHGMLGVSMGPITGKVVAQIICDEKTDFELSPFAIERFSGT
ncbi:MAG: FAD-binding oxidoreductase, partial [Anaerolineae bacterium]|nr:FAD-binding oxidoreductase [Anaerolineae bacterium]